MNAPLTSLCHIRYLVVLWCIFSPLQEVCGQSVGELRDSITSWFRRSAPEVPFQDELSFHSTDSIKVPAASPKTPESLVLKYPLVYRMLNRGTDPPSDTVATPLDTLSVFRVAPQKAVFAWYPYWMDGDSSVFRYNLLSTFAFFAYDVDSLDGSYKNDIAIDIWKNTPLIDQAKAAGSKVLLTITSFSGTNAFLKNKNDQQRQLVDSLKLLLKYRGANGIDVNFENLASNGQTRKRFSDFIRYLSEEIRSEDPKHIINITVPSLYDPLVYDIRELDKYADSFVLMGYEYAGGFTTPGPIAPLFLEKAYDNSPKSVKDSIRKRRAEIKLDISQSVDTYLKAGLPPDKFILALPHYGGDWEEVIADSVYRYTARSNRDIKALTRGLPANRIRFDTATLSRKFTYFDTVNHEVWFDDTTTLGLKYRWALEKKLKGVGMWALGYGHSDTDVWWNIADHFAVEIRGDARRAVSFPAFIWQYRLPIIVNLLFLMMFMILGFFLALFNWKVREKLFFNRTFRLVFISLFFVLAVLIISLYDLNWRPRFFFAAGLVAGAVLAPVIRWVVEYVRNLVPR